MEPFAVIFVVIMMVIGGIRWLIENLTGNQNKGTGPGDASFADLYEEARRQIQQRQAGQSQTASPVEEQPRILQPITAPPPAPPPLPNQPRQKAAQPSAAPSFLDKPTKRPALSPAEKAALARVQKQGIGGRGQGRRRRSERSSVRQLLASPSATRDAIVLREILGPPKGDY